MKVKTARRLFRKLNRKLIKDKLGIDEMLKSEKKLYNKCIKVINHCLKNKVSEMFIKESRTKKQLKALGIG